MNQTLISRQEHSFTFLSTDLLPSSLQMSIFPYFAILSSLLLSALSFSAIPPINLERRTPPPYPNLFCAYCHPSAPKICCAIDGQYITPVTSCLCSCIGGRIISDSSVECSSSYYPEVSPSPSVSSSPECATCSNARKPVCCLSEDRKNIFTADNECLCDCQGGSVSKEGPCPITKPIYSDLWGANPPENCVCHTLYSPVCCLSEGFVHSAGNQCSCACGGGYLLSNYEMCGLVDIGDGRLVVDDYI